MVAPPPTLRIVEKTEMSNGFPSGNAQGATTFWTWISLDFRNKALAIVGTLVASAVGISRIYLGVHFPAQVIGGWVIGFGVAGLSFLFVRRIPGENNRIRLVPQVIFAFATLIPLAMAVALGAIGEINPGLVAGYLFAFSLGAVLEDRYVRFKTKINTTKRVIRIVVGAATVGGLSFAMNPLLPMTKLIPAFANSAILGLAVVLIVPIIFKITERK